MENFVAYNPTRLHFGKGIIKDLGPAAAKTGKKALLVYGKGSVRRNGSYDDTVEQLKSHGVSFIDYGGIKPNPMVTNVDEAAELGIALNVDMIVAVGGGSVIDSAKIIAIAIADKAGGWDIMKEKHKPLSALPLIAVLTLAATGTEMNDVAVLQNHATHEKIGFGHELMFPVHSFLDPVYTMSVPADYTAYGIVDLVAHCLEAWFGKGKADLSDRFVISIIREAFEMGPRLMKDLQNYEYRERIMWAATNALNSTTLHGRDSGDWGVHGLGHIFSYLYDTAHGATLSMVYPAWIRHVGKKKPERITELGKKLFNVDSVEKTASLLEDFFRQLGSPVRASEAGIVPESREEVIELMAKNRITGENHLLKQEDYASIVDLLL